MVYVAGDYKVICDICGFERLASECKMTWDKLFVCADTCFEEKHPQYVPPKPLGEKQTVPIKRVEKEYRFVDKSNPITADDL